VITQETLKRIVETRYTKHKQLKNHGQEDSNWN